MDATPFYQGDAFPAEGFGLAQCLSPYSAPFPGREADDGHRMDQLWPTLHQAADAVAAMAGISADPMSPQQRDFPKSARAAGGWRLALAQQGLDDLAAIMEPGVAALLAAHARGADAPAAALALWEEFSHARDALMALLPPGAVSSR